MTYDMDIKKQLNTQKLVIDGAGTVTTGTGAVALNGDVTVVSAKKITFGPKLERTLTKTANYTVTDTDPDIIFIGAITALAHTTILLPTAADNTGRTIFIIVAGDPGTNDVIIDGEGSETINGATTKTNSTQYSAMEVICTGTEWLTRTVIGTWT